MFCRDLFVESKRAYITPIMVKPLLRLVWDGENGFVGDVEKKTIFEAKAVCQDQLARIDPEVIDLKKPKPFKVFGK